MKPLDSIRSAELTRSRFAGRFQSNSVKKLFQHTSAVLLCFLIFSNSQAQSLIDRSTEYGITAGEFNANFGSGVNFLDVDDDGFDDLTIVNSNDSLRLFLSSGSDFIQAPAPVFCPPGTQHVLWADYDNDGDSDLFVVVDGGVNRLFNNLGNFSFEDVTLESGMSLEPANNMGATFGDYDNDGLLDVYVCRYYLPNDPDGQTNKLYHNNGDGTFDDVTELLGVGDDIKPSFIGAWIDINNDLHPDLFVINDRFPANTLFRNNGDGTFTDITEESGVAFPLNDPMSVTAGDFNNDGFIDMFVSNSGSNSGLLPHILVNNGDETFTDQGAELGLEAPDLTWGGVWIDFDNDSFQDLFFCTSAPTPNHFFRNVLGMFFTDAADEISAPSRQSYTCAKGDFNNDGYEDIIVNNLAQEKPIFLENEGGENFFIKIKPTGTISNRQATGTWLRLYSGSEQFTKYTLCGENFKGQDSRTLTFGLGAEPTPIDSAVITYSSGHTDVYYNLKPLVTYEFTEGETFQVAIQASQANPGLCQGDSLLLTSNQNGNHMWSTGETTDSIYVTSGGEYSLTVTNAFGVTASDALMVEGFPVPNIAVFTENTPCHGSAQGTAQLQNQNGTGIETVIWNHGAEGDDIDSLSAGSYFFQLTDANGCANVGEVTISEPLELEAFLFTEPEVMGLDGSIFVTAFGGTPPYQIFLDDEETGELIEGLSAGTYSVKIKDFNLCEAVFSATIESLLSTDPVEASGFPEIYPNPAIDKFYIRSGAEMGHVSIIDLCGKQVMYGVLPTGEGYDITGLAPGTYILRITFKNDRTVFAKLVKS